MLLFSRRRSLGVYPGVDDFSAFVAEGAFLAFPPFPTKNRMQEVLLCQVVFRRKRGIPAALSRLISFDMLARAIVSLKKTFSLSGEEEVPCLAIVSRGDCRGCEAWRPHGGTTEKRRTPCFIKLREG